jgi:hypothetical protein
MCLVILKVSIGSEIYRRPSTSRTVLLASAKALSVAIVRKIEQVIRVISCMTEVE